MPEQPERTTLGGMDVSRLVCGLWQVADLEKDGTVLDPEPAAAPPAPQYRPPAPPPRPPLPPPPPGGEERFRPAPRLHQMVPDAGADDA